MELRDYLRIGRAHWIGVVACILFGLSAAFVWVMFQPRIYAADANGYVTASTGGDQASNNSDFVGYNLAMSKVKSYVEIGSWRAVAEHAIEELELSDSPESLVRRVTVTNPRDTVILEVRATGSTPESARDLASAWVRGMQSEIDRIETPEGGSSPQMRLDAADSARLPISPTSPNTRNALAIGALLGFLMGAAYALLRYTLDRRVRSAEVVEKETGLTVIGTIPDEKTFSTEDRLIAFSGVDHGARRKSRDLHAVSEAMRELRTNIQFLDVDNPPKIIVVTSALPGEGKTTIAANLAITLAASGQSVVLIDGDLRRPMVNTVFGLLGDAGLTDVLAGGASITDIAQPVGLDHTLTVVAAGKIPPNPSELLGSQRMHDLVHHLAESAFVIIDAPPLIPVTDAAVLSHNTDGAILVASVGKTSIDAMQKAQSNLDRAGGRALGVVLNRVPRTGAGSAYYGYRYIGDYYRSSGEEAESPDVLPLPIPSAASGVRARRAVES